MTSRILLIQVEEVLVGDVEAPRNTAFVAKRFRIVGFLERCAHLQNMQIAKESRLQVNVRQEGPRERVIASERKPR